MYIILGYIILGVITAIIFIRQIPLVDRKNDILIAVVPLFTIIFWPLLITIGIWLGFWDFVANWRNK
jgi:hypothetical protein